jgi:hypothetical protein
MVVSCPDKTRSVLNYSLQNNIVFSALNRPDSAGEPQPLAEISELLGTGKT